MSTKFIRAIVAVVFSTSILSAADQFSGEKGDIWTGGSFSFMSMWSSVPNSSGVNFVMLSPMMRFFPANNFCLGPKVSWIGMYPKNNSINMFGLGIDLGYAGGTSTIPYFLVSPQFMFASSSSTSSGYSHTSSSQAFILPFTFGTIIPIGKSLGLQLEAGYNAQFDITSGGGNSYTLNTITLGIGVCGLGQKVAVSVVNTFGLFLSSLLSSL
jgi:hypothetical protein